MEVTQEWLLVGLILVLVLMTLAWILYTLRGVVTPFTVARLSVWETLKLIYWPSVAAGLIVGLVWAPVNFILAWSSGLLIALYYYVSSYYTYVGVFGWTENFDSSSNLYLLVSSYLYSIIFGVATAMYLTGRSYPSWYQWLALALVVTFGVSLIVLTYVFPHWGIFSVG